MDDSLPRKTAGLESVENSAVTDYIELKSTLDILTERIRFNKEMSEECKSIIDATCSRLNGLGGYLQGHLTPLPFNERRAPDSTVASEVFHIPELAEMVLQYCTCQEIVHMSMTCHSLRNIIMESKKLRGVLFLESAPNVDSEENEPGRKNDSPFNWNMNSNRRSYSFSGLKVAFDVDTEDCEIRTWSVQYERPKPGDSFPHIGSKWEKLQLRYPPIYNMVLNEGCEDHFHEYEEDVSSQSGLTVGDLYKQAKAMVYRPCPSYEEDDTEGSDWRWCRRQGSLGRKAQGMKIERIACPAPSSSSTIRIIVTRETKAIGKAEWKSRLGLCILKGTSSSSRDMVRKLGALECE